MFNDRFHWQFAANVLIFAGIISLWPVLPVRADVPDLWQNADIGGPDLAGSADYDTVTGAFTIRGNGTFEDYAGTPDKFHFVYQRITGNIIMTARLVSMTNPEVGAKAGLMVRQSMAPDSPQLLLCAEPDGDPFQVRRRQTGHTPVKNQADDYIGFPMAFKVWRYNNQVGMFTSTDGIEWEHQCSLTLPDPGEAVYVGMAVASRHTSQYCQAVFDNVHVEPLVLEYHCSQIGNTFPGGTDYIQHWIEAMYVDPTGMIFTSSRWDEGSTECGIYDCDGMPYARLDDMHGKGGFAIAAGSQYVYVTCKWRPNSNNHVSVRRFFRDGSKATFSGALYENYIDIYQAAEFPRDEIRGIAVNENLPQQELYVSDHIYERIRVYDAVSMQHLRDFSFTRPGPIAVDAADNTLWIVQAADDGVDARVVHCNPDGTIIPGEIQGLEDPRGLAIHPLTGQVWVAEYGAAQQIRIFEADGTDAGSFGVYGGVYAATTVSQHGFETNPGEIHPLKFNGPTGIGFDSSGNIYVSTNGPPATHDAEGTGSMIRKFDPAGNMLWERIGMEFVDGGDADVTTDGVDVYTKHAHYVMDYSMPPGDECTYKGFTVDPFRFPDDWRYHEGLTGPEGQPGIPEYDEGARIRNQSAVMVRDFLGGKFLFLEDQGGNGLSIFRKEPASEIFIPSGRISRVGVNAPDPYIWRDGNGNYERDYPGEFQIGSSEPAGDIWGYWTDRNGDVWTVGHTTGIRRYICQGLDQHGNPIYEYNHMDHWNTPPLFDGWRTDLTRVVYHDDTDTMYLAGYTDDNRREGSEWGTLGREIIRYDNWYGSQSIAWRIELPYDDAGYSTGDISDNIFAKSMDIVGDYVFVGYFISSHILVYDRHTGDYVDTLIPGPELGGQYGWLETPRAISAYQRSDGEYLVFAHDETQAKILMYRYKPGAMRPAGNPPNVINGLDYRYYEGTWSDIPNYAWSVPLAIGTVTDFDLTPRLQNDDFGFRYTGFIELPADGDYTFYLSSSDGSRLYIGDRLVVDNDGRHDIEERSGQINLESGLHAIKVDYFYRSGDIALGVSYEGPGFGIMAVPDDSLYRYAPAEQPPYAPSNLNMIVFNHAHIKIDWDDQSDDELGFKIERKQEPGGVYEQVATVNPNVTYYIDGGLISSTTYTYRVRAYNEIGHSDYSNSVTGTTHPAPAPPPPANVQAVAGDGVIQLTWDSVTTAQPPALYYLVKRSTDAGGPYELVAIAFGGDNIIDKTVYNATTYYYVLQTVDSAGTQSTACSTEVSATPGGSELPPVADYAVIETTGEAGYDDAGDRKAAAALDPKGESKGGLVSFFEQSVIEDDNPYVIFQGDWMINESPAYSGGSEHVAVSAGSFVELTFTGSGMTIIGGGTGSGGMGELYIDGRFVQSVSYEADVSRENRTVLCTVTGLKHQGHTLRFIHRAGMIHIDAFEIQ